MPSLLRVFFGDQPSHWNVDERRIGIVVSTILECELLRLDDDEPGLKLLLIEEPEAHLHAQRQLQVMTFLEEQAQSRGIQVIITTHSPNLASAIALNELSELPEDHLEFYAEEVLYVPWSAMVGAALEELRAKDRQVAAVVNEFGETIGILTLDDILDTIFTPSPSRSERLLDREPIQQVSNDLWHVTGMTSLRRLGRFFRSELPSSKSVTVAGVLQESLQRLPALGDQCDWGPFHLKVIDVPERGQLVVELTAKDSEVAP